MRTAAVAFALLLSAAIRLSAQTFNCPGNLLQNPGFSSGIQRVADGSLPRSKVSNWYASFGTPQIYGNFGCDDAGYFHMWGNRAVGEALSQTLVQPLQAGHLYAFSACVRWPGFPDTVNQRQVRFRVRASCGAPRSYSADRASLGVTADITTGTWTRITLPVWVSDGDYDTISINAENESTVNSAAAVSWGQIDNVCLRRLEPATVPFFSGCAGDCTGSVAPVVEVPIAGISVPIPNAPPAGCVKNQCHVQLVIRETNMWCPNQAVRIVVWKGPAVLWVKTYTLDSQGIPAPDHIGDTDVFASQPVAAGDVLTVTAEVITRTDVGTCKTGGDFNFELVLVQ